ncbi:MAG: TIR domain-containing protein [Nitrososphaerota archaeon]|jgi:hypothetical protein|nr:TIR domain-containing protein [Nitrososphaerota archaeon]
MARRVFFSFHYDNDINRAMVVRNSDVIRGTEATGFVDKADFEKVERQGKQAVHEWIDKQLEGTSVTVVLIGTETLSRPFVQYEIFKSLKRENGVIGVHISGIKDMITKMPEPKENVHTIIGNRNDESPIYFDDIADGIYDYINDGGYQNLGQWIEASARKHGK